MNITDIEVSRSLLFYNADIILMRAGGSWCAPGRPDGTPMLIVPPHDLTDDEIDEIEDRDAFLHACTVIPFRGRGGWVLAHRLARRMVDAQERLAQAETGGCTALNLSGFRRSRDLWNVGPVTVGRDLAAFQCFVDEIFNVPRPSGLPADQIASPRAMRAERRMRLAAAKLEELQFPARDGEPAGGLRLFGSGPEITITGPARYFDEASFHPRQ